MTTTSHPDPRHPTDGPNKQKRQKKKKVPCSWSRTHVCTAARWSARPRRHTSLHFFGSPWWSHAVASEANCSTAFRLTMNARSLIYDQVRVVVGQVRSSSGYKKIEKKQGCLLPWHCSPQTLPRESSERGEASSP